MQCVLIIGEDAVAGVFDVIEDGVESLHRVAGKTDRADLALFLGLEHGGPSPLPDLRERNEFHVMHQEDIEMIGAESVE